MRLIDADELKWDIRNSAPKSVPLWVYETINKQPTAYDVDKTVEQLEEQSSRSNAIRNGRVFKFRTITTTKAIDIVKGGGVNE